jgi:hypothetical protein
MLMTSPIRGVVSSSIGINKATHTQAWREVQKLFDTLHAPAVAVHERLKQQH